jgi:pyruvate dehydrogenase E2 component (dihydrolipoamide acetyltransferase)
MAFEFKLPDIGEGIHEGEIVQWLVQPGAFVAEDQAIVEVMTDKVTAEIPSPVSGVIRELRGKAGEVIRVGAVIAVLDEKASADSAAKPTQTSVASAEKPNTSADSGTKSDEKQPTATSSQKPSMQNVEATASTATPNQLPTPSSEAANAQQLDKAVGTNGNGKPQPVAMAPAPPGATANQVLAAPATRKLARQLGVDLGTVPGSGPLGRVTQTDVRQFQTAGSGQSFGMPSSVGSGIPSGGFRSGGERRVPFTGLRRKIAEHLVKSKQTAPHFAYVEEVDMSRLVAMRNELLPVADEQGVKLSYLPFVIKAVIAGLRKYPVLNSQLDDVKQELVYKNDIHMGIAVATEQGLIVPVVKHADQKNLFALAREIVDLAGKARSGKLALEELKGGTFTLTSIGSIGGLFGIPILNHPEVGIMGVNKIERRPVVREIDGKECIVIRDMMHLSISCDHRVVDGAEAALFVKEVIQYLENPTRLLLVEGF